MSSRQRQIYFVAVSSVACLLMAGCGKQLAKMGELATLQQEIVKKYGEEGVHVNLTNDAVLTVTFINSPLNAQAYATRLSRAQDTASFIKERYRSVQHLEEMWVVFLQQNTHYVVITTSRSVDYFAFDKDARPMLQESPDMGEEVLAPTAVYSPSRNETDISITGLQLEGELTSVTAVWFFPRAVARPRPNRVHAARHLCNDNRNNLSRCKR